MYKLALQYSDPLERRRWLREAAHKGYAPAMYAFSLECRKLNLRRYWLQRAAEEGHLGAMYKLGVEYGDPKESDIG